ncbi:hypothetical protein OG618_26715 [Kitasatospora sp. NBC_01246]|uniref:hypothetical protein n=1 Tax=Kitasatospora sp. NBC_01246 TaxID=2903570 RepID=UPI002E3516B7|nr:hypothetical protein [Kitasatospora sp. NBC_01246]
MRLRTTVHRARTGRDEYRVLTVEPGEGRAVLVDGEWWTDLFADRAGARDLAAAWALAARSPRSLIHLPLRSGPAPGCADEHAVLLDLVLLHHGLGFPPSRWKEVRARLSKGGTPHTADLPESDFPAEDEIDYPSHHYAGWRDGLHFTGAARTLFLTGTAQAFRWTGTLVRSLDTRAARLAPTHSCVTLDHAPATPTSRPPKGTSGRLHIAYTPPW